ncbi:1-deoxy-D-xylulose-5-phosphate reductoisomerase [Hyphobacterium marinum]|uniref:1-deoxy-D-xylulose 5-phosphate reductoisomerase n=1 Tax=Hyphobacterium marinum TaxID=3116574 RepID=A0ABU7M143_9PROT|nr:1-deoxy-D-xylulose-5-phosphate reductoisomerase [Hyphobacterium sp. Y6023]MEE2567533.1 1-deoxy-D-xylulose-5-phosphate reductoisomerase [Hyphobacterium sp. Y6023]
MSAPRRISVLGATGSVGLATLDLVRRAPQGTFEIVALTAHRNVEGLADLAREFSPEIAVAADPQCGSALSDALAGTSVRTACGPDALIEAAGMDADWVMAAIVGSAGLMASAAALRPGAALAIANKECLVCSGDLFMQTARARGATVLPVDSEHNAIFQALRDEHRGHVSRITLTASGGPFRDWPADRMAGVTRRDALAHPVWEMGEKISIDSATMMNKGLEVIEACRLFDLAPAKVDVVVHPQSIVHGLVEYGDGSVLAQLGTPDMRIPIASTLAWPERMETPAERLDLARLSRLDFETPDPERFPALRVAREALEHGEGATAALNAANEVAVAAFLAGRTGFLDIVRTVEDVLSAMDRRETLPKRFSAFDEALDIDARARRVADEMIGRLSASSA